MATLKPWHKIDGLIPREDLREGKSLDAAEFAVNLDKVRDATAPAYYTDPEQFFERTYLTKYLTEFSAQVIRRLSGEITATSAIFNLATQFGGGKTHALTLVYHLAKGGPQANKWAGVSKILQQAGITSVPEAAVAVFVGTEFDSIVGRGGNDGTPLRKTPWGEIAYQLGGASALEILAEHERKFIEPKGDVIRQFLPKDKPCLILMDEIINYVSTYRQDGYHNTLYNFMQSLSETVRGLNNVVLVASVPASEIEYTAEDEGDQQRFKKMLDRLGKAITMSAAEETSEIIRRRLFEWDHRAVTPDGKIMLPKDAIDTCNAYADWVLDHRQQLSTKAFSPDNAREAFYATYPFHPSVLSVFEDKWQGLPRFQRTRGILKMLSLWVSSAYKEDYTRANRDPLITLGTAPLEDPLFRAEVFAQLGENRLEGAITTDICGKKDSHAVRLDAEANDAIKKARLHRKVSTAIFFESNGGMLRGESTLPEIRLAVAEPSLDIGNVETVLETLATSCYYFSIEKNKYRFSLSPNLNKIFADRRANVQEARINQRIESEIRKVFGTYPGVEVVYFPTSSNNISNQPKLTLVVLEPDQSLRDSQTLEKIETFTKECGAFDRTFKSAIIWSIADNDSKIRDAARKVLAWEDIRDEEEGLDESQKRQLTDNIKKAQLILKDEIFAAYKNVALLGEDNQIRTIDFGKISAKSTNLANEIINQLCQKDEISEKIGPTFLVKNWSLAFKEWSTKAVRDAFFSSPIFPRLINGDNIKDTIARGVKEGILAYVGKIDNTYQPFYYQRDLNPGDIEISADMFIIKKETAEAYQKEGTVTQETVNNGLTKLSVNQNIVSEKNTLYNYSNSTEIDLAKEEIKKPEIVARSLRWQGEVKLNKWSNFYTRVLRKSAGNTAQELTVRVEIIITGTIDSQNIQEIQAGLRELELDDNIETDIDN